MTELAVLSPSEKTAKRAAQPVPATNTGDAKRPNVWSIEDARARSLARAVAKQIAR